MRARSTLFTIFGDVVLPAGGEAWLSTLTGCMEALGFTPEATRTALHRMTGEGWVEPRKQGRYAAYRLTARGVDRLEEAAARIYRLRAADWDGRWRMLIGSALGRHADVAKALTWMGFGRLSAEVWLSPHAHGEGLDALLDTDPQVAGTARFVTEAGTTPDGQDSRLVRDAWDLRELRAAHAAFLDRWEASGAPLDTRDAFTSRMRLVHHWRSFLFLDPGLPAALLPDDWIGDRAASRFRELYELLESPAWQFYEELAAAAPAHAGDTPPTRRPTDSPFARGLQALHASRATASVAADPAADPVTDDALAARPAAAHPITDDPAEPLRTSA